LALARQALLLLQEVASQLVALLQGALLLLEELGPLLPQGAEQVRPLLLKALLLFLVLLPFQP